ncbi:MAG: Fic family protein, partial [archaeon]|nr:Fic family protein [archaeon]
MLMTGVSEHSTPGKLRSEEVSVVDASGAECFIACPAEYLREELTSLLDWLNNSPYDELVSAVLFFHEFESIHPFRDGNGRTGRTLFQILIQTFGLKNAKLCKFEKELLSSTGVYYDLLAYTDQTENYGPLVMYFAEALLKAYTEAVEVFAEKDILKDLDLNERRIAIMAKETRDFTLAEASGWVPMISQQSVRNKLNVLIGLNLLESTGMTRNLRYRFLDPLAELKEVHTLTEREGIFVETVDEVPIDSED